MRTLRAVLLALGLVVALTAAAPDQSSGREITRYDVTAVLAADGTMRVDLDFDFDFGDDPGHGPYLTLPTRVSYDDEQDREFRYSDVSASSSTDAPAQVNREDDGSAMILRIGDEDIDDVSGVQTYRVSYTVDGLLNPANEQHSGDELYWNVIGAGWEIPLGDLSVSVQGPSPVQGAVCFAGPYGSNTPCTSASFSGDTSQFTQDLVPVGDQFSTVTGWPAGSFPGVEPILVDKLDPLAPVRVDSGLAGVAGLVLVGGGVLAAVRVRRVGRDRAYLGLTPGLRPADNQPGAASGYRDKRGVTTVQFQPPEGVRPGEVGTLVDEKADPVDVTATLVDLAVRGWLRIEEVPRSNPKKKAKDWTLVQLRDRDGSLLPFEDTLLREIFSTSTTVKLSDLKTTFASSMAQVQDGLYEHVTANGWFRANPKSVRTAWHVAGVLLMVVGRRAHDPRVRRDVRSRPRAGAPRDRGRRSHRHPAGQRRARPDRGRHRGARAVDGLPPLPGHRRGEPAAVRGGRGHLQPVPALRDRVRSDRPLGARVRRARCAGPGGRAAQPGTSAGTTRGPTSTGRPRSRRRSTGSPPSPRSRSRRPRPARPAGPGSPGAGSPAVASVAVVAAAGSRQVRGAGRG